MLRRSSSYLLLAIIGTAGVWLWSNRHPASVMAVEMPRICHSSPLPRRMQPPATRLDFLTDLGQPYQVRINLLRSTLASECSEPEIRDLYQRLAKGAVAGEIPEHGYVIANDIMIQLLGHETDPQRFTTNFTELLNDCKQPEVVRDYAVQYLASWLNPRSAQGHATALATPSPEIAAQVLKSLVTAATDPTLGQTTIPGTTLMMLVDLTRSGSGVDCRESITLLKPWLGQALAAGSTLSQSVRVSAVIAAGVLAPDEFRPTLRKIAYQPAGSAALQLPALASLGQSGEATDLPQLQNIAATQPALAYAAADACRVLTTRLTSVAPKISQ
jgi:hypothetical protein